MTIQALLAFLAVTLLAACSSSEVQPVEPFKLPGYTISKAYDPLIKASARRFMPNVHWHWWKGQIWQESRMKPDAVSPVGAGGLAQIMPGTFRDIQRDMARQMGLQIYDRFNAEQNLNGGAFYMNKCMVFWTTPRPLSELIRLGQACYNAGGGNILKAQRLCDGVLFWIDIKLCLPMVTGDHSRETIDYVRLIEQHKRVIDAGF